MQARGYIVAVMIAFLGGRLSGYSLKLASLRVWQPPLPSARSYKHNVLCAEKPSRRDIMRARVLKFLEYRARNSQNQSKSAKPRKMSHSLNFLSANELQKSAGGPQTSIRSTNISSENDHVDSGRSFGPSPQLNITQHFRSTEPAPISTIHTRTSNIIDRPSAIEVERPSVSSSTHRSSRSKYSLNQQSAQPIQMSAQPSLYQQLDFARDGHTFMFNLLSNHYVTDTLLPQLREAFDKNSLKAYQHLLKVEGRVPKYLNLEDMSVQECLYHLKHSSEPHSEGEDAYNSPFLQLFNLWQTCAAARAVALSPALGSIAARLLGVNAVRLYQDSLFVKQPGHGPTLWHSDLNMCPLDTNHFLTCWIPLQEVHGAEKGGTGLIFASKSHVDFALPYWHDLGNADLEGRYEEHSYPHYNPGDVSFHHGWTIHSSPPNLGDTARYAYSVSYMADGTKLLPERGRLQRFLDDEDSDSYRPWLEDVGWGSAARHALLPLVYPQL